MKELNSPKWLLCLVMVLISTLLANGETFLYSENEENNIEAIMSLIINGVNIDENLLHVAASMGHVNVMKLLLENGFDADQATDGSLRPIHLAAQNGHLEAMKLLLEMTEVTIDAKTHSGATALYLASLNGHSEAVQYLITKGAKVNEALKYGESPLWAASLNDHTDVMKILMENGADVEQANENGWRPIHAAAHAGHLDAIKLLLEEGNADFYASTNSYDSFEELAIYEGHVDIVGYYMSRSYARDRLLLLAATHNQVEIVKLFIDSGVNPGSGNGQVVFIAAQHGHVETMKYLLETVGFNVNIITKNGTTALHMASAFGHVNLVRYLIAQGANVNAIDNHGVTPLELATNNNHGNTVKVLIENGGYIRSKILDEPGPLHIAVINGSVEEIERLMEQGNVEIDSLAPPEGRTALFLASLKGHSVIVEYLISKGARMDVTDMYNQSPLEIAIFKEHIGVVSILIENGVDVERTLSFGFKSIHVPARWNSLEMIQILVEEGKADVNSKTNKGDTAIIIAIRHEYEDIIKYLITKGADLTVVDNRNGMIPLESMTNECFEFALYTMFDYGKLDMNMNMTRNGHSVLHWAAHRGRPDLVKYLLSKGVNVNEVNGAGESPIFIAASKDRLDVARILIEDGAKVEQENIDGWRPLHAAAHRGHLRIVELLVEEGNVNVNSKMKNGNTALYLACERGRPAIVKYLLNNGARANESNEKGESPLYIAVKNDRFDAAKILIENGADVEQETDEGLRPIHIAASHWSLSMVKLLIEEGNADINAKTNDGSTALTIARMNNRENIVEYLTSKTE